VLAVISDPRAIAAILAHLETRTARAPPPVRHWPCPLAAFLGGALGAPPGGRLLARPGRQPGCHDRV